MRFIYTLLINLYTLIIFVSSFFNTKAKKWIDGRRNWKQDLNDKVKDKDYYWFHCASLGEFEQGRPLMERIKNEQAQSKILLTFFSPSGYENRKNYAYADVVCYLPADTPGNVKYFLDLIKPKAVFFIKYEFWFNYLNEIKKRNITCYLISGVFRQNQHFFKFYGSWFLKHLNCFTFFFLQNEESGTLLTTHGFTNYIRTGDTRFDRCLENAASAKEMNIVNMFKDNNILIIVGSSWPAEEKILAAYVNKCNTKIKYIIAPHEIHEAHLNFIESLFSISVIRYSNATTENIRSAEILLIDNIGMLSSLYKYADIAIIGGAFHGRLHNSLEAAVFGVPLLFGPNHYKNVEATELIQRNAAFSFSNIENFSVLMEKFLENPLFTTSSGNAAKAYITENAGATTKIINTIFNK